jgi:hypothetical protein
MLNRTVSEKPRRFTFDLTRHYKIWFSKDPDTFLGIENELRFIRMRKNNPDFILYFIYSSQCLSKLSIEELKTFCRKHKIIPVEFEAIVQDLVEAEDIQLYAIANNEIVQAVDSMAGSMAAASDCTRLLTPVIEKFGIYNDFDVEINLAKLDVEALSLPCPFLLTTEIVGASKCILSTNSDFLAFSIQDNSYSHLTKESYKAISDLRNVIIHNYNRPFSWQIISPNNSIHDFKAYPNLEKLFEEYHKLYPNNPTIFNFRTYIESLVDLPLIQSQLMSMKTFLFSLSVVNVSGPGVYSALFNQFLPENHTFAPLFIPQNKEWIPFLQKYNQCGLTDYKQINAHVLSKNKLQTVLQPKKEPKERPSDLSWTTEGMNAKKERENNIKQAACMIQRNIRRKMFWEQNIHADKFPDESLLIGIRKVCHDEQMLTCIEKKEYSLAFRRACCGLKLPVVRLLLQFIQRGLEIDLIGRSSNGNTALDWVLNAKTHNQETLNTKNEMITLLTKAGALQSSKLITNTLTSKT